MRGLQPKPGLCSQAWGLTADAFLLPYLAEVSGKRVALAGVASEVRVCHLKAALLPTAELSREFV